MQNVSDEYKESMKSSLRNRGYIKVVFGLVNKEAQSSATVSGINGTVYSNTDSIFEDGASKIYATLEQDFAKADGSMFFLPREGEQSPSYYDTGIVSKDMVSDVQFSMTVDFNQDEPIDVKGFSISFGDCYPTSFDLIADTGQTLEVRDNTDSDWHTEEVFEGVSSITITVYAMKNTYSRVRIYYITIGYGLVYTNSSVTDSKLEGYVSPIAEDVPQIDFEVTILNYDKYFNVDNPTSAIHYLETGQEMSVQYGYELDDGTIEWVNGGKFLCSDWEANNTSATLRAQDALRNLDSEYYKGTFSPNKVSFYDLAVTVLTDAGLEKSEYYLDPVLATIYTDIPLPKVAHKEALQIIANACCCILSYSREGLIQIVQHNIEPVDFSMTARDMTSYPNATKEEAVKEVTVVSYSYQESDTEKSLLSETVKVAEGEERIYYFSNPSYGFSASTNGLVVTPMLSAGDGVTVLTDDSENALLADGEDNQITKEVVEIVESGSYYIKLRFLTDGEFELTVIGREYIIVEQYATVSLGAKGKTVKWENPLVNSLSMAQALAEWLAVYYSSNIEYEYSTRGNPELDAGDVIYQENDFIENMAVVLYRHTINFKQAFSGSVTARRLGNG